uniref:Uncharacterized protein n=1 Tax=Lygus hesperus TaxID=30085 RepID=A0A146LK56_LYGHE
MQLIWEVVIVTFWAACAGCTCLNKTQLDQRVDAALSEAMKNLKSQYDLTDKSEDFFTECGHFNIYEMFWCQVLPYRVSFELTGGTLQQVDPLRRDSTRCYTPVNGSWDCIYVDLAQQRWTVNFEGVKAQFGYFNIEGQVTVAFNSQISLYTTLERPSDSTCHTGFLPATSNYEFEFTPTNFMGHLLYYPFRRFLYQSDFLYTYGLLTEDLPEVKSTIINSFYEAFC